MKKNFRCTNAISNAQKLMYFIFYKIFFNTISQFDVGTAYMKGRCQFSNIFQRKAAEIPHTSLKIIFHSPLCF